MKKDGPQRSHCRNARFGCARWPPGRTTARRFDATSRRSRTSVVSTGSSSVVAPGGDVGSGTSLVSSSARLNSYDNTHTIHTHIYIYTSIRTSTDTHRHQTQRVSVSSTNIQHVSYNTHTHPHELVTPPVSFTTYLLEVRLQILFSLRRHSAETSSSEMASA